MVDALKLIKSIKLNKMRQQSSLATNDAETTANECHPLNICSDASEFSSTGTGTVSAAGNAHTSTHSFPVSNAIACAQVALVQRTVTIVVDDPDDHCSSKILKDDVAGELPTSLPHCTIKRGPKDTPITIHLLEDTTGSRASGNGATLWDCSILLTEYLLRHCRTRLVNRKILELGAGLGLPSLSLAIAFQGTDTCVTISERKITIDLLLENVLANFPAPAPPTAPAPGTGTRTRTDSTHSETTQGALQRLRSTHNIELMELDWQSPTDQQKAESAKFEVIIASEVIFPSNREVWPALVDLLARLLSRTIEGSSSSACYFPVAYFGTETRNAAMEADFYAMLASRHIDRKLLHVDNSSTAIYIYELRYRSPYATNVNSDHTVTVTV